MQITLQNCDRIWRTTTQDQRDRLLPWGQRAAGAQRVDREEVRIEHRDGEWMAVYDGDDVGRITDAEILAALTGKESFAAPDNSSLGISFDLHTFREGYDVSEAAVCIFAPDMQGTFTLRTVGRELLRKCVMREWDDLCERMAANRREWTYTEE